MFRICSRVKTNGTYTECAKMDIEIQTYNNTVYADEFNTIDKAVNYIKQFGNKCHIYYVCEPYNHAFDKLNVGKPACDAGNNYYVRQRLSYVNKEWTRITLHSSKLYSNK